MSKFKTSLPQLDRQLPLELVLELISFAGGENTKDEDAQLKNNEARLIENWDCDSLGGMQRSKGFNLVATGGAIYTAAPDLIIHHKEGASSTAVYGVIEGDVVLKSGASLAQEDNNVLTSGVLCHGVSAGDKLFITNATDNLKLKNIGVALATPAGVPSTAHPRIYHAKFRLFAEGNSKTIEISRAGSGNWNAANTWSLANDACSIDLPDISMGMAVDFPSGGEDLVFTRYKCYALSNYPDVVYRPIPNGIGCELPYTIARGIEGVFFVSRFPTLGVFLFNGVDFIELTIKNNFVDDIDPAKRCFGIYRDHKYYLFYCESGSGATYPNRVKIYDTRFGRWMSRPVNTALSDNFGYPAVLQFDNSELYVASSRQDSLYELETTDDDDEGNNTEATYKTKIFSSRDFMTVEGAQFPIDLVRLKIIKIVVTYFGYTGNLVIQWTADRGARSGSQTITMSATGDLINSTFNVNTSYIVGIDSLTEKTVARSLANSSIGRFFQFDIINAATGNRPKVRSIKVHAVAVEEL